MLQRSGGIDQREADLRLDNSDVIQRTFSAAAAIRKCD